MSQGTKSIVVGFLGSIALLVLYFVLMLLGKNSFSAAIEQLSTLALWIIPLITTFGIEIGLFTYIKSMHQVSGKSTAVSGTTSGVAMVACCAHHITDILPLVGLSVFATFLTTYQPWFLALGIGSNIIAIVLLLRQFSWTPALKKRFITGAFMTLPPILLIMGYIYVITTTHTPSINAGSETKTYQTQENDEKEVAVSATPVSLSSSQNVVFAIAMNNHMYDLSNDLKKTATLKDNKGNIYKPISWDGPTGGHHVSGQLVFPSLTKGISSVTLNLPQIAGIDRTFTWNL